MVIITDGNGNIQSPNIPDNVYQGSNLANEIVFLAPLPQSNQAAINFKLPNGLLTKQFYMTPYTDVPSEYNLSAWRFVLPIDITQYYGQVDFQIILVSTDVVNDEEEQPTTVPHIVASCRGSFQVLKGVPPIETIPNEEEPEYNTFVNVLAAIAALDSRIENAEQDIINLDTDKQDKLVSGENIKTINGSSILGEGNLDTKELFYCTYNTTTYAEITSAISAGKLPVIKYGGYLYIYENNYVNIHYFGLITNDVYRRVIVTSSNLWGNSTETLEKISNKVTSILNTSTDVEYPSAKAVYDAIQNVTIPVDDELSSSSENPVQNKVITNALAGKQATLTTAQQNAVNSGIDSTKVEQIATNTSNITTINSKIPAQASSENQLADKNFVNSSIATNTANFIGTFANVTALNNYSGTITNNDYANVVNQELDFATTTEMNNYSKALLTNFDYGWVVNGTKYDLYRFDIETQTWGLRASNISKGDVTLITAYNRYTYNGNLSQWAWNYTINTSGFTAQQWAAINSGATAEQILKIGTASLTTTATNLSDAVNELNSGKQNTINNSNKLSADYLQDGTTNKIFTATDKTNLDNAVHKTGNEDIYGLKAFDQRPKVGIEQELPSAYSRLDYIQSTNGQYINTGYNSIAIGKSKMKLSFDNVTDEQWLIGYQGSIWGSGLSRTGSLFFVQLQSGLIKYTLSYYSNGGQTRTESSGITAVVDQVYEIETQLKPSSQYMKIDGVTCVSSSYDIDPDANYNAYLFRINGSAGDSKLGKIKLYEWQLYDRNNNLIRDYVPCKRISDNEAGLYDFVSETFYPSATTSFVGGSEITPSDDSLVMIKGDIVANPTLDGTESVLTGIEIKGTKHKIPQPTTPAWGEITGTLSNQTDLQNALNAKSIVSVSDTGTATDEVQYITINGVEKKLAGGSGSGITNYEVIDRLNALPTATATSPDFIQYSGGLYQKKKTINLKNTTWLFKNTIEISSIMPSTSPYERAINLEITSNSSNYAGMYIIAGELIYGLYYVDSNNQEIKTYDAENNTWSNDNYKTIVITDGLDVNSIEIFNWLKANATLQSGTAATYSYEAIQDKLTTTNVSDGTINKNIGFDSQGNIVKATPSGGGGSVEGLPLGFIFPSALPQLNNNYHLLNGDSILIADYSDFYTLLTTLVSQSWDLTCTANEYAEDIAKTGNCGKFVINDTNSDITGTYDTTTITVTANSFKLPTITRFIQGISSITDLGNSVEAGLPNITGNFYSGDAGISPTGAFYNNGSAQGPRGNYDSRPIIALDASRSSSIYGNSATVQPQAIQYPYYIVVKTNSTIGLMNYINDLAEAGVQSLGGAVGDITLDGLKMTNNVLGLDALDLLWENPSPTSSFAAQTVSIPNISNYDIIFIEFKLYSLSETYSTIIQVYKYLNGMANYLFAIFYSGAEYRRSRRFTFGSSGISFEAGYNTINSTQDNTLNVPNRIYGVKL